ncbi:surface protease GP63 [Trypanosoma conorhini]|uniref:Leishmanolysin-like peptidase n=1 Tax=Trypanosoma conorhini TaxID=83891 RepID=A0A422PEN4_9TRYP|nr:surface protease GP63 [Trypanosoma conorhini]RNF16170.1 surface protease GP63 [Trypanosoma conorhini]
MVLYVAAGASAETWAVSCAVGSNGRPIAGALHLSPSPQLSVMHSARAAAHAIAHALGFGVEQMTKLGMLEDVNNVRGNPNPVTVVKSPLTLEKTKAHYGCTDLPGMELLKMNGAVQPYWSPRNAKDELMSFLGGMNAGLYTALTMAAFEDLGYYKAVWGMEEPMAWGSNSGCDLLKSPCSEETSAKYPGMFCDKKTDDKTVRCTSNRQALGPCDPNIAGLGGAPSETCSIFWPDKGGPEFFCSVAREQNFPGSLQGSGSWCLDAEALKLKGLGAAELGDIDLRAVCAQVQCGEGGTVKVKYLGASEYVPCLEGGSIKLKSEDFESGELKCPKYEDVCTIAANGSSLVSLSSPNKDDNGGPNKNDGSVVAVRVGALVLAAVAVLVAVAVPL